MSWIFNPNDYEEKSFEIIPAGDYRCRIDEVVEKTFKSGNAGYEVTLSISGKQSKLWHYIVLDHSDPKKTNQRIGGFFDSFGITDPDLSHFRAWVGKVGAVRVVHEDYNGSTNAKVRYCIGRKGQDKLPPAQFNDPVAAPATAAPTGFDMSNLPFDM